MNKNRFVILAMLLAAVLLSSLAFSGCDSLSGIIKGNPSGSSAPASSVKPGSTATDSADSTGSPAAMTQGEFAADFKTVEKNPLHEDIQYALWLAANAEEEPDAPGAVPAAEMKQFVDKYQAIVADKGIHYVEASDAMGFSMKTECWIKGGKFKKVDATNVTIYDGLSYVQYKPDEKKGTSFSPDYGANELTILTKGMLASYSLSPYQQQKDQKFGKFNCSVFFMDVEMELLGMKLKGSTLFVDKETGMLVKNVTGDPKDKENSIVTYVESLTAGGFGDEVFAVPADITVEDYKP